MCSVQYNLRLVCGFYGVGKWLLCGRYISGWSACIVGMWLVLSVRGRYVFDMRSVRGRYVFDMWSVHIWYVVGTFFGTYLVMWSV